MKKLFLRFSAGTLAGVFFNISLFAENIFDAPNAYADSTPAVVVDLRDSGLLDDPILSRMTSSSAYVDAWQLPNTKPSLGVPHEGGIIPTQFNRVHLMTGAFRWEEEDIILQGVFPFVVKRAYASDDKKSGALGYGWHIWFLEPVFITNDSATLSLPEKGSVLLKKEGTGVYREALRESPYALSLVEDENVWTLVQPTGESIVYEYAGGGAVRIKRIADAFGNAYNFTYRSAGRRFLERISGTHGIELTFDYDDAGRLARIDSSDGRYVAYTYDRRGDLVCVENAIGACNEYTYCQTLDHYDGTDRWVSTHQLERVTNPEGVFLENHYDFWGRVVAQYDSVSQAAGVSEKYRYVYEQDARSASGETSVFALGSLIERFSFSFGYMLKQEDALGGIVEQAWGRVALPEGESTILLQSCKDKRGLVRSYKYDDVGHCAELVLSGALTGEEGLQEAVYRYEYDAFGRVVKVVDPKGGVTSTIYGQGVLRYLPVCIQRHFGEDLIQQTEFTYNVLSEDFDVVRILLIEERISGGVSPDKVTSWEYDAFGNIVKETQKSGSEDADVTFAFEYTSRGEIARATDASGAFSQFEYNPLGDLVERVHYDAGGTQIAREAWSYDAARRLVSHEGPFENPVSVRRYFYGKAGLLEQASESCFNVSPDGSVVLSGEMRDTQFAYDGLGRKVLTTYPDGGCEYLDYDVLGFVVSKGVLASGGDELGREFFKYNTAGDLLEHTSVLGGKESWNYTQEGRVVAHKSTDGLESFCQYDLLGRITQQGVKGGLTTHYAYAYYGDGLHVSERLEADGVVSEKTHILDARKNVISKTDALGNVFTASYDGLDRIVSWRGPSVAEALSEQQAFKVSYDPKENTVSKEIGGCVFLKQYDLLGRVLSSETFGQDGRKVSSSYWLYEDGGRRIRETKGEGSASLVKEQLFDDNNKVLFRNWGDDRTETFAYDGSGNLVFETTASGQERYFEYDALGRLIGKTASDGPSVAIHYDVKGHRVQTLLDGGAMHEVIRDLGGRVVFESLSAGEDTLLRSVYRYYENGPHAGLLKGAEHLDGTRIEYTYDGWRRPLSARGYSDERQDMIDYSYEARGYLSRVSTGNSEGDQSLVERDYDSYGNIVAERVTVNDTVLDSWTQSWNALGHRTQLSSGDFIFNYKHDALGHLLQIGDPWRNAYTYDYDLSGRMVRASNPWRTLTLGYADRSIRPSSRFITRTGYSDIMFAETLYYSKGRVSSVNRLFSGAEGSSIQFAYDKTSGRLLGEYTSEGSKSRSVDYLYDASKGACVQRFQPGGWNFKGHLDTWGRIKGLNYEVGRRRFTAWGAAPGAESVRVFLDGVRSDSVRFDSLSPESVWFAELDLPMGEHTMRVDAADVVGDVSSTESTFTVLGQSNEVELSYDGRGNVVEKRFVDGTRHSLGWDAWGRLIRVDNHSSEGGFSWKAIYDGLGRQIRSIYIPKEGESRVVIDSSFDPEVEFLEIKATHQGRSHWFVYGPDATQRFGGLQGLGGLEAVVSSEGSAEGILSDLWGNSMGSLGAEVPQWNAVLLSGYGPEPTQVPAIFPWEQDWSKIFAWRGHRLEMSGYYRMGVRPYDASLASFLSPDPHGMQASANLYTYANGDPLNAYDPEGRNAYLLDGTWAHEDGMQNNPALTNAQRLHLNYVGPGESHYFRGVGNSKDNSWFAQYWGGATGSGAREIVEDAYNEIVTNYNNGDRHIFIAGWSRGAAESMELTWMVYNRGIPNLKRGGYLVPPEQACPVIDQVHLMDTVHSMGVPGNDINRGWHDLDMPPNIYRTYHYLAGDPPAFGFRQTRPPSANERAYCGGHGDIGGSVDTDCRRWVYRSIIEHANGHGLALFDEASVEAYVDGDPSR